jgi:DegV family protein with EDD domain
MTAGLCILTDSTAQFSMPSFVGNELVQVIPFSVQVGGQRYKDSENLGIDQLPYSAMDGKSVRLQAPGVGEFRQIYLSLSDHFSEVLTILLSAHLSPAVAQAQKAAASVRGRMTLPVIDSQSVGAGLGLLVQAAAEAAQADSPVADIQRMLRQLIPHIYAVFCVQNLTYLSNGGHIDPAQAVVGEMLGVSPILLLEGGRLTPVQKARNNRNLLDLLTEFISEFGNLKHIAMLKGSAPFDLDEHLLHERIHTFFPSTPVSEHGLNLSLAALFGPRCLGLVVMEG